MSKYTELEEKFKRECNEMKLRRCCNSNCLHCGIVHKFILAIYQPDTLDTDFANAEKEGLSFSSALNLLKDGKKVRRNFEGHIGLYYFCQDGNVYEAVSENEGGEGKQIIVVERVLAFNQEDLFAMDWMVVE